MTYLPPFVKSGRKVRKFPADHPASQPSPPKAEDEDPKVEDPKAEDEDPKAEDEDPKVEDPKAEDEDPKVEDPEELEIVKKPDLIAEGVDPEVEVDPPKAKKKAKKKRSKKKKSADDDK